jgi:hypothetical protein
LLVDFLNPLFQFTLKLLATLTVNPLTSREVVYELDSR